jgi:primary-amine oxidase
LQETDLTTTGEAQRVAAPERARIWKIKNPAVINPVSKTPVAYKVSKSAGNMMCRRYVYTAEYSIA